LRRTLLPQTVIEQVNNDVERKQKISAIANRRKVKALK
jgi:hypothetical protein